MLDLGLPRAFGIATLTLAATLTVGAAHADPPTPPAAPGAAAAKASPPAAPDKEHVDAPAATPVDRAPPGYGWAPGYSPAEDTAEVEYPKEMRARSSGMVAGGVVLLSFGMVGLIAGSTLVGAHTPDDQLIPTPCQFCEGDSGGSPTAKDPISPAYKTAGIVTLVGSVAALGVGTTLLVFGAKQVPVDDDAGKSAKLTPTVRVGPAGATLRWQF